MNGQFWYVYMLQSVGQPGRWYVGTTVDLEKRLKAHNSGKVPHTSKFLRLLPGLLLRGPEGPGDHVRTAEHPPELFDDRALDLAGGDGLHRTGVVPAVGGVVA